MTKEEAERVIKILCEADGGCSSCSSALLKLFCKEFPDYIPQTRKAFREVFKEEIDFFD